MNVNELFASALQYEESLLAHTLYCGLKDELINGEDEAGSDLYDRLDLEKGFELHKQNVLGIHSMKLYSVSIGDSMFAMFFAPDEQTAKKLYKKEFKSECKKAHLVDHGMDISTYDIETKEHQTWRGYRDSLPVLPAYVGIFQKN